MRRSLWIATFVSLAMGLGMAGLTTRLFAQEEVTIVGEVVDWNCYKKDAKNKGAAHRACALNCAKTGAPLGLVDEKTGTAYRLAGEAWTANKNEKLIPFVAERVTVKGKVEERGGEKILTILSIEKAR